MKCSKALQKPLHYRQDNCAHRIPSPAWYRTGGLFYCALLVRGGKPETPAYLAVRTGIVLQCGDAAGLPQQRRGSAATLNPNVESVYGGLPHFFLSRLYHQKRERFFDVCDRLTQAVAMTGGMTFIVSACSPEHWVIMAALITA